MDPAGPVPNSPVPVTSTNTSLLHPQAHSTSRELAPTPSIAPTRSGNTSSFNSKKAEKWSQRNKFKKMEIRKINRKIRKLARLKKRLLRRKTKLLDLPGQKDKAATPATSVTSVTEIKSDPITIPSARMSPATEHAVSSSASGSKSIPYFEGAAFKEGAQINNIVLSRDVSTQCEESPLMCFCSQMVAKKIDLDKPASNWLSAVADYVRETNTSFLDLGGKRLEIEEVQSVLSLLPDSQVTELNLEGNFLRSGVPDLLPFLARTKITGLNVSRCGLTEQDISQLLEALRYLKIIELDVEGNLEDRLSLAKTERCIFNLKNSKLKTLILNFEYFSPDETAFFRGFLQTSISCLNLRSCCLSSKKLTCLFTNLGHSSITDLSIENNHITDETLQVLSDRLVETKLERLSLDKINLQDKGLEILVKGLPTCNIINFELPNNRCSSFTLLFAKLKKTKIRALSLCNSSNLGGRKSLIVSQSMNFARLSSLTSLDLSYCRLQDKDGEKLMEALRSAKVTELDISHNELGLMTIGKLADNIKDIKLLDLDISHNSLRGDGIHMLGGCLKDSELTCLDISSFIMEQDLFEALKLTEGSSISRLKMEHSSFLDLHNDYDPKFLAKLPLREVHLSNCNLKSAVLELIKKLKFTSEYLNLCDNEITDDFAVVLAKHLKETQIRRLDLSANHIHDLGAESLSRLFKDSSLLYLNLKGNRILGDRLCHLAEAAKDTYVTELDVYHGTYENHREYYREPLLLIEEVLWRNKTSALQLISFFKQIAPETNSDEFLFSQNISDLDVSAFIQKCLWFCKTIIENPQAVGVLLEEESITFSKEEILSLVSKKFPRQFSQFIAYQVEADVSDHVRILRKAEEMKLTSVVEELLCNRGAYVLDKKHDILHPFVYGLLHKYKQLICSFALEPRAKEKIIEYFTQNVDIDGAQDVINLLSDGMEYAAD